MSVVEDLEAQLYTTLTGGTALTSLLGTAKQVWNTVTPGSASYPIVYFQQQADTEHNYTPRRGADYIYLVKAISKTSKATALNIQSQIDTLMHGKSLSVTGYGNFFTARETGVVYSEQDMKSQVIWHAGATYRIRLSRT